jgi:hypothetical protein
MNCVRCGNELTKYCDTVCVPCILRERYQKSGYPVGVTVPKHTFEYAVKLGENIIALFTDDLVAREFASSQGSKQQRAIVYHLENQTISFELGEEMAPVPGCSE